MTIVLAGNTYIFSSPLSLVDTISPYAGVKTTDLTSDGLGNYPQRIDLSNMAGYNLVPSAATKFKIGCHLFRAIPDVNGNVDISCCAAMDGFGGTQNISNFATGAFSGAPAGIHMFPPGSLVESLGQPIEFPNVARSDGTWGSFYWQMRGNTPIGSAVWLELVSFDVAAGYTLPSTWPAQNPGGSLAMYFGASGYFDSSTASHPITVHNSTIQPDGGAAFNGTSSYLSFNGSDSSLNLSGDFTIEITMSGTSQALEGGSQQRLLSFGNTGHSIGIAIDNVAGGAMLLNESNSVLKIGGNSIVTGLPTTIKWTRASGINTLIINGQQDGVTFTDGTSWTATSESEIGRLNSNTIGYFSGEIYNINIVNGVAV